VSAVSEERSDKSSNGFAAGILLLAGGLAVTGVGFGLFAEMARGHGGKWGHGLLTLGSVILGIGLVEIGLLLNAALYRRLEESPYRLAVEATGGVLLAVGVLTFGVCFLLYWLDPTGLELAGAIAGLLFVELALAALHARLRPLGLIPVVAGVLGLAVCFALIAAEGKSATPTAFGRFLSSLGPVKCISLLLVWVAVGVLGALAVYRATPSSAAALCMGIDVGGPLILLTLLAVLSPGSPHDFLALGSVVLCFSLVELGSWLNAPFYRALGQAPKGFALELAGGAALVLGALLFGNFYFLASVWPTTSLDFLPLALAGLLLVGLALAALHRYVLRICSSPSFVLSHVVMAAGALGLVALALVSSINVRHYCRADLTRAGHYRLSEQTLKILASIDRPMRIIGTMVREREASPRERFNNMVREWAEGILREYDNQSRYVDYIPLNPYRDPDRTGKLAAEMKMEIPADAVLFAYEEKTKMEGKTKVEWKTKIVELSEIISMPQFRQAEPQLKGEEVFTSALQGLIEGKTTKVYFARGHGEKDIDNYESDLRGIANVVEMVRGDNCEVKTCDLPEIPDDCDVLVVAGPKLPYRPEEIEALRNFLTDKGGGLILLLDPVVGDVQSSGLEPFLEEQGIQAHTKDTLVGTGRQVLGGLILEGGTTTYIETVEYGRGPAGMGGKPHPIVRDMKNIETAYHIACRLSSMAPPRPGPYGQPQGDTAELVRTPDETYAKTDADLAAVSRAGIDRDRDQRGPFTLAIARGALKEQPQPMMGPMGPPRGRLVVFADSDFITNMIVGRGVRGNSTLFRNAAAWAAGKEYKISIPPKPLPVEAPIELTSRDKSWIAWATRFAAPFQILMLGLIVWWVRRR
jgi:hypothetical protein